MKTTAVIVLGDIGRSPRMQYHALSLANQGYHVNLIGYAGSSPLRQILEHPCIQIVPLKPFPLANQIPKLLEYILKTIWQTFTLLYALMTTQSDLLLLQNPPAVPTIPVCLFVSFVTRATFIIDWHNYAYTIMALTLRANHPLVWLTKRIESWLGARAHANFCVSNAMKSDLEMNWGLTNVHVVYDRPPEIFQTIDAQTRRDLFERLANDNVEFARLNDTERPVLIVSSTSWTEDEDFSILLDALEMYDRNELNLPSVVCAITGKGPLKVFYEEKIRAMRWTRVKIVTVWLHADDYPRLLAAADVGVCLHMSSSGLDLPMKVVDMFGCRLPVFAFNYRSIGELVRDDINGFTFNDCEQLAKLIVTWCEGFPNNERVNEKKEAFREELKKFQSLRWEENWRRNVLPVVEKY